MNTTRRRYDTEALVQDFNKERRRMMILVGALGLAFVIVIGIFKRNKLRFRSILSSPRRHSHFCSIERSKSKTPGKTLSILPDNPTGCSPSKKKASERC